MLGLLPENLRKDPDIIAAAAAVDQEFFAVVDELDNLFILPNVDSLGHDVLDHLSYYLLTPYYDRSYSVEEKRQLIKDSLYMNMIRGTPRAVEILTEIIFGNAEVEEWFQYGGAPYSFRVIVDSAYAIDQGLDEFLKMIDQIKNVRSWLDPEGFIRPKYSVFIANENQLMIDNKHFFDANHRQVYPT